MQQARESGGVGDEDDDPFIYTQGACTHSAMTMKRVEDYCVSVDVMV